MWKRLTVAAVAALSLAACDGRGDHEILAARGPIARNLPPADEGGGDYGGGGGGGGGGGTTDPFDPPPAPQGINVPVTSDGATYPLQEKSCKQVPHLYVVGSSTAMAQGTTIYPAGVVVPGTRANFYIYNAAGQLVKTHLTALATSNCVILQEPEAVSTWDLPPGYYYVYGNFYTLQYPDNYGGVFGYALEHGTLLVTVFRIV